MDDAAIQRITANAIKMALREDREERDRQSQLATQAAVAAALANQTQQVQALRRPDLAPFDPNNIEVWIHRIEFAYTRSGITAAKDKFAFLEKLFHAKDDPRVNAFLWGAHTDTRWNQFLEYLRERYGRTRKQEVYSIFSGIPRDGRRPTVHADLIRELTANVTVDDIRKEMLLKEIPAEVRQHLAEREDDLDFDGTAKALDKYFDKTGKLKDAKAASVNHVSSFKQPQQQQQQQQQQQPLKTTSFTAPFSTDDDDDSEVNAVRFRQGQKQQFNVANRSSSRGRSSSSFGSSSSSGRSTNNNYNNNDRSNSNFGRSGGASSSNSSSNPPKMKVCHFHSKFGEEAQRCEGSWCILKDKIAPKGQASR